MTLEAVIDRVDGVTPSGYPDEVKAGWLSELEADIQSEIFLLPAGQIVTYDFARDRQRELLVKPPHDRMYTEYLTAQVHYARRELEDYTNDMLFFNASWDKFEAWYAQNYRPADTHCLPYEKKPMGKEIGGY
jgi:hypothetical protein